MNQLYNQIISLRKELNQHNYNYYVLDKPTISDNEFDIKLKHLDSLEKEYKQAFPQTDDGFFLSSPTQRVGGETIKGFRQVEHKSKMLSLSNTYSKQEIEDFVERVEQLLTPEEKKDLQWICELKYDGVAVSLQYKKGQLVQALTRGNGEVGDDITNNIRTIKTIPLELIGDNYPEEFEIRGEVIFPHKAFEEFNKIRIENSEEPFANPRNAASGSMKLLDSKEVAKRRLDCVLYFLLSDEKNNNTLSITHSQRLKDAKTWGFNIMPYSAICNGVEDIMDFIDYWDKERFSLGFDIDGIVIKLNNSNLWQKIGSTAKSPRWATSYKFKAERLSSKLLTIEYQVGRTGVVTPVANFEPVWLGGSWVKRASLHNADQIEKLNLYENDTIFVEKGGEIIPKVVAIDLEKRQQGAKKIEYISHCPECGTLLVKEASEAGHYCPNYNHCPTQILARFSHFISKKAMNIDSLGQERIKYLLDSELVKDFADLYSLTETDLIGLSGKEDDKKSSIQEKGARNIIDAIEQSKTVPFERVLYALGIRFVGEITAKLLARQYKTIESLSFASYLDLIEIDTVGDRIAQSIIDYFSNSENVTLIARLKQAGLNFETQTKEESSILENKSFVVSGTFTQYSRDAIKSLIESNGGRVVSSISKKTDYLLAGEKMGPEKKRKAEQLEIKIISEQDFLSMIEPKEN